MSKEFFNNFPIVNYNGRKLRNIILKSDLVQQAIEKYDLFHPLTIEDGERPDTIAYDYYGDSELYWVVLMSNGIIDPYYDWPMTQAEFKSYIIKKYGTVYAAMHQVIHWRNSEQNYVMTPTTKANLSPSELSGWNIPVYAYDWEMEKNEAKREIRLLDKGLVPQLISELGSIYGE